VTTEKAPVAGAPAAGLGSSRRAEAGLLSQALRGAARGGADDGLASLLAAGRPNNLSELASLAALRSAGRADQPGGGAHVPGSGAAAAAGVLTAIDEDNEGDVEAPVPADFDYFTDGEEEEEL